MTELLRFADVATRDDLRIFLQRLQRAGEPEVRVVSRGGLLAVFGCTQAPRGILDAAPVVMVMRAFALAAAPEAPIDATFLGRALLDRLARLGPVSREFELPQVPEFASWAGVLPPMSGWRPVTVLDADSLRAVAAEGIARVAAALPEQPGEALVHRVRSEVWGAQIADGIPAAAAFAAEVMGFIGGVSAPEHVAVAASLTWTRLSTERGHVLVRGFGG